MSAYSEELIDIGIGMNPKLTGQGYGFTFFSFILSYIHETFNDVPIRLTVAIFNHRAIHLYKKLGFVKKMEFNKESTEFITMVRNLFNVFQQPLGCDNPFNYLVET